jgi:hypothetical protein
MARIRRTLLSTTKAWRPLKSDEYTRLKLSPRAKLSVPKDVKRVTLRTVTTPTRTIDRIKKVRGAKRAELWEQLKDRAQTPSERIATAAVRAKGRKPSKKREGIRQRAQQVEAREFGQSIRARIDGITKADVALLRKWESSGGRNNQGMYEHHNGGDGWSSLTTAEQKQFDQLFVRYNANAVRVALGSAAREETSFPING